MRRLVVPTVLTALIAAVPSARADQARRRVSVGVFMVGPDGPLSPSRRATLLFTMERALERDRRLEIIDADRVLAEKAGVVPAEMISEARGLLESGEALLRKEKPKLALLRLQAAHRNLERSLAWTRKADLARAQFLLGATHAVLGNDEEALAEFTALQVWRPGFPIDTTIAPGEVLPVWERARVRVKKLPGGSLEITSSPDRALAYVDGRFVGFTPTTAEGLAAGSHYVTFRKLGYVKAVVRTAVSGQLQHDVRANLVRIEDADELTALIAATARGLGESPAPPALAGLTDRLGIDHALFVRAPATGDDDPSYHGFLYAAEGRKLLATARARTSDDRGIDQIFPDLARAIYSQVVFEPPPPEDDRPRTADKRFYQRWWFWTGLGVLAAGGAALPLLLGDDDTGPSCPPGNVCGTVIFDF